MHENLQEMIKEVTKEAKPVVDNIDVSATKVEKTEKKEEAKTSKIGVLSLYDWFEKNKTNFANISRVKVEAKGVNAKSNLVFAVLKGKDKDGNVERELYTFKGADTFRVLDLPGAGMNIFNNGFKIVYGYDKTIAIKAYGIKTGLMITYCMNVDGLLIPYSNTKLKKKDAGIELVEPNVKEISKRLAKNADIESVLLLYKQLQKSNEKIVTNMDLLKWFIEREKNVVDINHFLLIDKVLTYVFAKS
jgi:hypothetical protein